MDMLHDPYDKKDPLKYGNEGISERHQCSHHPTVNFASRDRS